MSDHINNLGKKGKGFGLVILGFILFFILLIYVYHHPANNPPLPL